MNYANLTKIATTALKRNKFRAILTMLGIIIGVGSVIAMSLFSFLIGLFTRKVATTLPAYKGMLLTFAFLAIGVGIVWLVI